MVSPNKVEKILLLIFHKQREVSSEAGYFLHRRIFSAVAKTSEDGFEKSSVSEYISEIVSFSQECPDNCSEEFLIDALINKSKFLTDWSAWIKLLLEDDTDHDEIDMEHIMSLMSCTLKLATTGMVPVGRKAKKIFICQFAFKFQYVLSRSRNLAICNECALGFAMLCRNSIRNVNSEHAELEMIERKIEEVSEILECLCNSTIKIARLFLIVCFMSIMWISIFLTARIEIVYEQKLKDACGQFFPNLHAISREPNAVPVLKNTARKIILWLKKLSYSIEKNDGPSFLMYSNDF